MKITLKAAVFLFVVALAQGCGEGASGTATLSFVNTAGGRTAKRATTSAPSIFGIKLIAAYLAQDIDGSFNNVGGTAFIYLNPECNDDISHCDISAGTAEDGAPMSQIITSFFDFALPSSSVNSALNAQGRSIEAATYKYVRLEFCKYNSANTENIRWGTAGTGEQLFQRNQCTVNSEVMDPPLTVAEGDSVSVTLSYDYSAAIASGADATGDACTGSGAGKVCFTLPTFTPSAE